MYVFTKRFIVITYAMSTYLFRSSPLSNFNPFQTNFSTILKSNENDISIAIITSLMIMLTTMVSTNHVINYYSWHVLMDYVLCIAS